MTDHLSIGEVLSLLQDEFPDVTISKIRFLESQGLIDPERTPSGYRKFYEADIDRLRWILVQQREHFLPLKVIKDRLADPEAGLGELLLSDGTPPPAPAPRAAIEAEVEVEATDAGPAAEVDVIVVEAEVEVEADGQQPIWMADVARASAESKASAAVEAAQAPLHADTGPTEVSLTAQELALAAGITREALRSLEQYGLLAGRPLGDDVFYDGDALIVASKAAGFLEQLAMPLLKQRNPQARRDAVELVEELSALGHDLRSALLRANLRRHLDQA